MSYRADNSRVHIFIGGFKESETSLDLQAKFDIYVYSFEEHFVNFHHISKNVCYTKLSKSWFTETKQWVISNDLVFPFCVGPGGLWFIRSLHVHSINLSPSSPYDSTFLLLSVTLTIDTLWNHLYTVVDTVNFHPSLSGTVLFYTCPPV